MATWVIHLRCAERYKHDFAEDAYTSFLVGNIAPDAGELNADKRTYTPPSSVSHLRTKKVPKWESENLSFYRRYIQGDGVRERDTRGAFYRGYFLHLVVDELWRFYVAIPTKNKLLPKYRVDPAFGRVVRSDWSQLDKNYLLANPNWQTWRRFTRSECKEDYLPFYSKETISRKIESIANAFSGPNLQYGATRYLRQSDAERFIELTKAWIDIGMKELSLGLRSDHSSMLHLLSDKYNSFSGDHGDLRADHEYLCRTEGNIT